jgi:hypothetical protein
MYVRWIFLMLLCISAVSARAADTGEAGAPERAVARPAGPGGEERTLSGEADKAPDAEKKPGESAAEAEEAGVPAGETLSALDIFRMLPPTIFDNTVEGLSEEEKEHLLAFGGSEYWIVLPGDRDSLELVSLPFGETRVLLHVYHRVGGDMLAVVGSRNEDFFTLEIWQVRDGAVSPADAPPEPPVTDFFARGNKMPKGTQASILFCPEAGGLEAQAVFWDKRGRVHMPVDNEVRYVWTGENFEKQVLPKLKPGAISP